MDARLGQGIGIWERYVDERGHFVEANYMITDFLPPTRIAFRGESFFARKQPNKSLSAAALARTSRASWVSSFEPIDSYTRFTVEETFSYPLAWVYWIVIPFRSSTSRTLETYGLSREGCSRTKSRFAHKKSPFPTEALVDCMVIIFACRGSSLLGISSSE
jgi:hypothetical protein